MRIDFSHLRYNCPTTRELKAKQPKPMRYAYPTPEDGRIVLTKNPVGMVFIPSGPVRIARFELHARKSGKDVHYQMVPGSWYTPKGDALRLNSFADVLVRKGKAIEFTRMPEGWKPRLSFRNVILKTFPTMPITGWDMHEVLADPKRTGRAIRAKILYRLGLDR